METQKTFFILGIILIFSLSFFVLFLPLFLITSFQSFEFNPSFNSKSTFQYQEISHSSKHPIFGTVSLNKQLSDDEFITYHNEKSGSSIIISPFTSSRFKCSGSCTCHSTERRSIFSSSKTRPLSLLISTFSTSVALKIASKTFNDQCVAQFSSCDEQNIQSEVQECSENEEDGGGGDDYAEYSCEGHCILSLKISSKSGLRAQGMFLEETGGCETLKTSGFVRIKRNVRNYMQTWENKKTGEKKEYVARFYDMNKRAKEFFSKQHLSSYCKSMSSRPFVYLSPGGQTQRRMASMCIGSGRRKEFPDERLRFAHENIRCSLISDSKLVEFNKRNAKNS